jgi:transglutaminase-like putative cysteine protease
MQIRAGFEISYYCFNETPMALLLSVHPDRMADLITRDQITTKPDVTLTEERDQFGNRVSRVVAPPGLITFKSDFIIDDSGMPDIQDWSAKQVPVAELPTDVLPFLLGSRYCETDRMSDLAWSLFGGTPEGWARVQAIVDYAHNRISFGYQHARATRTAMEGHEEQRGVCRDFAHLAVALCRCMNIPARYCTGYLGDIGIPPVDAPMDFSAWFEVYLDGRWFTFDARHNTPRIGRIVMARGRDATDVAISTTFGVTQLTRFTVITEAVNSQAAVQRQPQPATFAAG